MAIPLPGRLFWSARHFGKRHEQQQSRNSKQRSGLAGFPNLQRVSRQSADGTNPADQFPVKQTRDGETSRSPTSLRFGRDLLFPIPIANAAGKNRPTLCHPDRSVAQWRDLQFPPPQSPLSIEDPPSDLRFSRVSTHLKADIVPIMRESGIICTIVLLATATAAQAQSCESLTKLA